MNLPQNDDFSNRELSLDELDAVAAGWSIGGIVHSIGHGLKSFFTHPVVVKIAAGIVIVGGILTGAASARQQQN